MQSLRKLWVSLAVFCALGAGAAPAPGQTQAELVRARQLYSQGLTQEAAGDWAGALGSFEEVARIKVTPQVRFHVARSKEHLGRLNEALGGYRLAEWEAEQAGGKEQEIVAEVRKAREALEARIPKLTLSRGNGADAIKIELDGVALGDAQIGKEITVDPGPHVLVGVVAPGKTFKKQVHVAEGESIKVTLDVPDELGAAPPAEPERPPKPEQRPVPAPARPEPDAFARRPSYVGPMVLGGVGIAAVAASVFFYKKAGDAKDELDAGCIGNKCPDTLRDTQSRGETYTTLGGVSLGIGIASLAAGAVLALGSASSTSGAKPAGALGIERRGVTASFVGVF